jgi:hypothetical protein
MQRALHTRDNARDSPSNTKTNTANKFKSLKQARHVVRRPLLDRTAGPAPLTRYLQQPNNRNACVPTMQVMATTHPIG